jgi:hypothetical protein
MEDEAATNAPAAAEAAGAVANWAAGADAGAIENENEPAGAPPTAHDSCQLPTSPLPAVPDFDQFPLPSVVPIGVPENEPEGMEPETVTGAFGEAPVIETSHVSPTWRAVPPREVVKINRPPWYETGLAEGMRAGTPTSIV